MQPCRTRLTLAFASLVFGAVSVSAIEPSAIETLSSGELVILNITAGIEKVSGTNVRTKLVNDFGSFQAVGFTVAPVTGGDEFLVSLRLRFSATGSFPHLNRYNSAGKKTAEWYLREGGGVLADIAVDSAHNIAYCSDSRLNAIYQLDISNERSSFVTLVRIRDAGILGPMILDANRGRLLIADVEKGRILSVMLDGSRRVEVVFDQGTVAEPIAMILDRDNDRLYILDAARKRVWVGTPIGSKWSVKAFSTSQKFKEPISLALARDGSLWVADRGQRRVWLFAADGTTLRTVVP